MANQHRLEQICGGSGEAFGDENMAWSARLQQFMRATLSSNQPQFIINATPIEEDPEDSPFGIAEALEQEEPEEEEEEPEEI